MDRQIPDVWNIFDIGADGRRYVEHPDYHHNWSQKDQELLSKWCDRSSACDRPRTYDKFYQRNPWNFASSNSACSSSSDNEEFEDPKKSTKLGYSRTITERDVRHIDRQLSMKKTIRKKIMRDLQRAFVDDPDKFAKSEIKLDSALHFDHHDAAKGNKEQKLLDMLRDSCSDDSGIDNDPTRPRKYRSHRGAPTTNNKTSRVAVFDTIANEDNRSHNEIVVVEQVVEVKKKSKKEKRSLWQILTGKKKVSKDSRNK